MKTDQVVEEILERLSFGEPLAVICRDEHMPHPSTWRQWCRADESLDIEPERVITVTEEGRSSERLDSAGVQWAKNRAEMRLKLLAKWDPRRYGDKLDLTSSDGTMTPQAPIYNITEK
jgi:hypothetical protein